MTWHVLTPEYAPDPGGVADYTALLAPALAAAVGPVHIWAPGTAADGPGPDGVTVHRLPGAFRPAGLWKLGRQLDAFPRPRVLLVQYVPHGFGWKAMNVPFAAWVLGRRLGGDDVRVMFHEVATPWVRRPRRHNVIAAATHVMAALLVRACTRAYISVPGWEPHLRRFGGPRLPVAWTPIPATVPDHAPAEAVAAVRDRLTGGDPSARVVGHFGTYGRLIAPMLPPVLSELLESLPEVRVLLIGGGSDRWREEFVAGRPDWVGRVVAVGRLPAADVATHLRACDLVVQPYPDGVSSRRTSVMAAVANGVPVATTTGPLTEAVWDGAVALAPVDRPAELVTLVRSLLANPDRLAELGRAGKRNYESRFALARTVPILVSPRPA